MSEQEDNSFETIAYRAAADAFMTEFQKQLGSRPLRTLYGSVHQHTTVVYEDAEGGFAFIARILLTEKLSRDALDRLKAGSEAT